MFDKDGNLVYSLDMQRAVAKAKRLRAILDPPRAWWDGQVLRVRGVRPSDDPNDPNTGGKTK